MNEEVEIWKDVVGWEGLYAISNLGNVKSYERKVEFYRCDRVNPVVRVFKEKILKLKINGNGYISVCLQEEGRIEHPLVHRLVAKAFLENSEDKFTVNHIDCDKTNNNCCNLEWSSSKEQNEHYSLNGRYPTTRPSYSKTVKDFVRHYYNNHEISIIKLSELFNISERTVGRIINS